MQLRPQFNKRAVMRTIVALLTFVLNYQNAISDVATVQPTIKSNLASIASALAVKMTFDDFHTLTVSRLSSLWHRDLVQNDILDEMISHVGYQVPVEYMNFSNRILGTADVTRRHRNNFILIDDVNSFRKIVNSDSNKYFSFSGYYLLVLSTYHGDQHLKVVQELLTECWMLCILNVNIVTMNALDPTTAAVYTYFPFTQDSCNASSPVDNFEISGGKYDIFPDKTSNMYGCPVTVIAVHSLPFVILGKTQNGGIAAKGIEVSMMDQVSYRLNFTMKLVTPRDGSKWGRIKLENGKVQGFTGAIEMLFHHSANMSIGTFVQRDDSAKFFDNTFSHMEIQPVFIAPPGKPFTSFEKLFLPFHLSLWILLTIIFLIAVALIATLKFFNRKMLYFLVGRQNTTPLLNMVGIFICQLPVPYPKRNFARFIAMLWLMASLILSNCYQGALYNFLQSGMNHSSPDTIDKMIDAGLEFKIFADSMIYFQGYPRLLKHATAFNGDNTNFFQQLLNPYTNYTFQSNQNSVNYRNTIDRTQGIFHTNVDNVRKFSISVILPRDSYLTLPVSRQIESLLCSGLTNFWQNQYVPMFDLNSVQFEYKDPKGINLHQILGCIQLCMGFCLIGCFVFFLEIVSLYSIRVRRVLDFITF